MKNQEMYKKEEKNKDEEYSLRKKKLETLGVMAGSVANEFNNLLMGIMANADLGMMELPLDSPVRENFLEIEKAALKAASLSNRILVFSGEENNNIEEIDLSNMIEGTINLLEVDLEKNIKINYDLNREFPIVNGIMTQLRQIIIDLVHNARQCIGKNEGEIRISTGILEINDQDIKKCIGNKKIIPGKYSCIKFQDSGNSIEEKKVNEILNKLYSEEMNRKEFKLSAVIKLVKEQNGHIKLDFDHEFGTGITIVFPYVEKINREISFDGDISEWRGSGTLLIIDDEDVVLKTGKRILEKAGFSVITASCGKDGIEKFKTHKEEIICTLLDLQMDDIQGENVYSEIHKLDKDACVIVSSGCDEKEFENRFKGEKPAAFLQKPYKYIKLISTLRETFE